MTLLQCTRILTLICLAASLAFLAAAALAQQAEEKTLSEEDLRKIYWKIADDKEWWSAKKRIHQLLQEGYHDPLRCIAGDFWRAHRQDEEVLERDHLLWYEYSHPRLDREFCRNLRLEVEDLKTLLSRFERALEKPKREWPAQRDVQRMLGSINAALLRLETVMDRDAPVSGEQEFEYNPETDELEPMEEGKTLEFIESGVDDPGAVLKGDLGCMLDRRIQSLDAEDGGFCGSVLATRKDEVLLYKGYGMADEEEGLPITTRTMWDWASISKQFTAAAILKLEMEKKLSLSDPLRRFFPKASEDKARVTLHQLLNHTSGIPRGLDEHPGLDVFRNRDRMVDLILGLPMKAKPGEEYLYSNMTYSLLAAIVDKVSGQGYENYCMTKLFRPAGMKDACFIGSPGLDKARVPKSPRGKGVRFFEGEVYDWAYKGSGGVLATPMELFAWDRALRGHGILSREAKARFYQPDLNNYALGWEVFERQGVTYYAHSGSVGHTVTYLRRSGDGETFVALAYSYRPKKHPSQTATLIEGIVRSW
jgi:CubicO group peptidase (beta-lactamase class C family)